MGILCATIERYLIHDQNNPYNFPSPDGHLSCNWVATMELINHRQAIQIKAINRLLMIKSNLD